MTHPGPAAEAATDLDEAFGLEDPQCLTYHALGDTELIHQLALDRQRFPRSQITSRDA